MNPRTGIRWCTLAAGLACTGPACERPTRPQPVPSVRDSAGIRIVAAAGGFEPAVWKIGPLPVLDIAAATADGEPFRRIRRVLRLRDGGIVVGDEALRRVLWFTGDGRLEAETGAPALESVWPVGRLPGDSVVVWDGVTEMLRIYDGRGQIVHSRAFKADSPAITPWGVFPDGSLLASAAERPAATGPGIVVQDTVVFWVIEPASGERQPILRTAAAQWFFPVPGRAVQVPYTGNPVFDVDGDEVLVTAGSARVIERWSRSGRLLERLSDGRDPVRVSRSMQSRYRERRIRSVRGRTEEDSLERDLEGTPWPEFAMAWDRLVVAEDGRIWVRDYGPDAGQSAVWTVFDGSSGVIAQTRTPPGFEVMAVSGDFLLGVEAELGGEHVRAYRIER
jgi:hypothetical protein